MFFGVCDENGDLYTTVQADSLAEVVAEIPESWTAEEMPEPQIGRVTRTGTYLTEDGVESGTVVTAPQDEAAYADKMMGLIHEDMAGGLIPRDVGSFSGLHDYCDANMYTLEVIPEEIVLNYNDEGDNALVNAVLDECDRRLAREAVALGTGEQCSCGRLARFNGGSAARGHFVHIDDGSHVCDPCQFCR